MPPYLYYGKQVQKYSQRHKKAGKIGERKITKPST